MLTVWSLKWSKVGTNPNLFLPCLRQLLHIKISVNKVIVVLQRDVVKESKSNCLLDFNQVQGPLNNLRAIFNFSLPPLTLRNRDFSFTSSGWHRTPGRTTWEIIQQSFEWCHYTEKFLSGKVNEEFQHQPKFTSMNSKNICIIFNTFWRTATTKKKIVQMCLHRKEVILKDFELF